MHREFGRLLTNARGVSEHVVAAIIDIRDFSRFSSNRDSAEVGLFIKTVYIKMLGYFTDLIFFKPTGDGLLVIRGCNDQNPVYLVVSEMMTGALQVLEAFPSMCNSNIEPLINFDVPQQVGIGMTRGAVSCLQSGGKTLDYSGTVLNRCARLMDLARPSGIVFDRDLGIQVVPIDYQKRFQQDNVYIRGVTDKPVEVYHTSDVQIPDDRRQPIPG